MKNLHIVSGPPGTGKTTYLTRQIERAASAYDPSEILVTSFTRAAAVEVASRAVIPKRQIGTLHALCFRAFDQPELAETQASEWNKLHPEAKIAYNADESSGSNEAEEKFTEIGRLRAMMIKPEYWQDDLRELFVKWTDWKLDKGLVDFTDLLEQGLKDLDAPGNARVLFVDEAQDLSPLQNAIIQKWGEKTDRFVLVGDDDQLLYDWAGASAEPLIRPTCPEENIHTLEQSYRIPQAVHRLATEWIQLIDDRYPKTYKPRNEEGKVLRSGGTWKTPECVVANAAELADSGESVAILAPCSFQLNPTIEMLRTQGIPFENKYRRRRGDWNPLVRRGKTSSIDRAELILDPNPDRINWSWAELWTLIQPLPAKLMQRGAKAKIEKAAKGIYAESRPAFEELWTMLPFADKLLDCDTDWYLNNANADRVRKLDYPIRVFRRRQQLEDLRKQPLITVGTIHSVKGGEADHVFLIPELSTRQMEPWLRGQRDSIIRMFYVGMTRARYTLRILNAHHTQRAVL